MIPPKILPLPRQAINDDRFLFMYDPLLTLIFIIIMIFIFVMTIVILILFIGKQIQRKDMVAETTSQEGVKPGEETRIIVPLPVPSLPPTTMGCSCSFIKVSYFLTVIYSFSVHLVDLFNMPDVFWRLSFATSAIMTVLESEVTDEIFVVQLRTSLAQAIIFLASCGLSSRRKNERKESLFYPESP